MGGITGRNDLVISKTGIAGSSSDVIQPNDAGPISIDRVKNNSGEQIHTTNCGKLGRGELGTGGAEGREGRMGYARCLIHKTAAAVFLAPKRAKQGTHSGPQQTIF